MSLLAFSAVKSIDRRSLIPGPQSPSTVLSTIHNQSPEAFSRNSAPSSVPTSVRTSVRTSLHPRPILSLSSPTLVQLSAAASSDLRFLAFSFRFNTKHVHPLPVRTPLMTPCPQQALSVPLSCPQEHSGGAPRPTPERPPFGRPGQRQRWT
jgi:hypothetical protein